jgi:hypothetical protein
MDEKRDVRPRGRRGRRVNAWLDATRLDAAWLDAAPAG